jgi:hypothetical protein
MTYRFSESPSGRTRRWEQRRNRSRSRSAAPWFFRPLLILLAFISIVVLAWQGVQYALRNRPRNVVAPANVTANPPPGVTPPWQRDVFVSLDESVRHAIEGDVTETNVSIDRAASLFTNARLRSQFAPPDFFDETLAKLDEILSAYHTNSRLTEHVTLARIELAQLRSSLEPVPATTPSSIQPEDLLLPNAATKRAMVEGVKQSDGTTSKSGDATATATSAATSAMTSAARDGADKSSPDKSPPGQVFVGAPRTIAAGAVVNPESLGGTLLDATNMPLRSEILEPPMSRLFTDNVHVEDLTIVGATQTLDGIHWKNVTFIGTRLRYEGGELDLNNVHFIHCLFGFEANERGARVATAIARGETRLVIE